MFNQNKSKKNFIRLSTIFISSILFLPSLVFNTFEKLNRFKFSYDSDKIYNEIINETKKLKKEYRAFTIWRTKNYSQKNIKISGKYNTRNSIGQNLSSSTWFFGGSGMWGYGVKDSDTIPSHFYNKTGLNVYNFAGLNWNSRQSLNQLVNTFGDGYKPSHIVFYDGKSNVINSCRSDNNEIPQAINVFELIEVIKDSNENLIAPNFAFWFEKIVITILEPHIKLISSLNNSLFKRTNYDPNDFSEFDCHHNHEKRKAIASHIVNDWYSAYLIAKANNIKFSAVLEPLFFYEQLTEDSNTIQNVSILEKQGESLYKSIKEAFKDKCNKDPIFCLYFIDGSYWIENNSNDQIDLYQLLTNLNSTVADKILEYAENF